MTVFVEQIWQLEKSALNRGWIDCISLTHDPDFQSPASYVHANVQGQRSVGSEDTVETKRRTTDRGSCITFHNNAVGKNYQLYEEYYCQ